jgi:D-alanyl-lipoteichoic acid acyltransferase DltB (MBOAT superfamily)
MSITSFRFVLFLLPVLAVYYFLPRRPQNYWLLLVSYAFFLTWDWQFALVLFILTAGNFVLAQFLGSNNQRRRGILWFGILMNLGALVYFRIANFFLPGMLDLLARLGVQTVSGALQILLPIGLSYYILENISYLVDVSRKQVAASRDFVDFALYLAYFPKLLAGPIERASAFLPKLAEQRIVDNDVLARSFTLIVIGAVRKLVIADYLASLMFWDVFETPAKYTAPELIAWLLMYALILYNDFAGYTSIVRGMSGLFGIELSPNFSQPYFARNFTEFWNRWHITLSHWLRDYIFFPISRALLRRNPSRRNLPNVVLPPLATMLASGLWHGFSLHMLFWGVMHGFYQVAERILSLWRPVIPPQQMPTWRQVTAMIAVFLLVVLAWVPFRMELPVAFEFWRGMLDWTHKVIRFRRVLVVSLDWLQYHYKDEAVFLRFPRPAQAVLLAGSIFMILILSQADISEPFVYQGF